MKSFDDIIAELQGRADCCFLVSTGFPVVPSGLPLPPDLIAFYQRFSEARLFSD